MSVNLQNNLRTLKRKTHMADNLTPKTAFCPQDVEVDKVKDSHENKHSQKGNSVAGALLLSSKSKESTPLSNSTLN